MLGEAWLCLHLLGAWFWLSGSALAHTHALTPLELAAAAIPVGIIGSAWITYIFSSLLSMLEPLTLILSLIAVVILVLLRVRVCARTWARLSTNLVAATTNFWAPDNKDNAVGLCLLAILMVPAYALFSSRMIPEKEDGSIWSGGSCWADLPIHMHIAETFLTGRNSDVSFNDMHSPIFAGEKMYYPFLPDWHAAVMVKVGSTLRRAFLSTGLLLFASFVLALYSLGLRVWRSRTGAVLAVTLTILSGGMGGIGYLFRDGWGVATTIDTAQNDISGDQKVWWFAFLPHVFLPQRGATFAYPLALVILILVWRATDSRTPTTVADRQSMLLHAAGFAGMLPFVQTPAFLGLGVIIGTIFIMDFHKWLADFRLLRAWLAAGTLAALTALPQLAYFNGHLSKARDGRFTTYNWLHLLPENQFVDPAGAPWTLLPFGSFFRFWCNNLGPALPLFLLALGMVAYDAATAATLCVVPTSSPQAASAEQRIARGPVPTLGEELASNKDEHESFVVHMWLTALHQLPTPVSDVLTGRRSLETSKLDELLEPLNAHSVNGRAFDQFKLGLGALLVFMIGNYVILQPWDRDNTKLLYIWVFVYSVLVGGMLAAPIEAIQNQLPGARLLALWTCAPRQQPATEAPKLRSSTRAVAFFDLLTVPVLLFLSCFTGFAMLVREYHHNYELMDADSVSMGRWIRENIPPKAVMLHRDHHIIPSGSIAGRPSLIGYAGWVDSHGYNYGERQRDREYILQNMLKETDKQPYNVMRRWGIRYILGEDLPTHPRPRFQAYERALAANKVDPNVSVPEYDPNKYLDGQIELLHSVGRFGVYVVHGYPGVPGT